MSKFLPLRVTQKALELPFLFPFFSFFFVFGRTGKSLLHMFRLSLPRTYVHVTSIGLVSSDTLKNICAKILP